AAHREGIGQPDQALPPRRDRVGRQSDLLELLLAGRVIDVAIRHAERLEPDRRPIPAHGRYEPGNVGAEPVHVGPILDRHDRVVVPGDPPPHPTADRHMATPVDVPHGAPYTLYA